jgi:sporulation protein YlmC with PRC-barrel domain
MSVHHSDLRPGTPVYSSDQEQIGSLECALVDSATMQLRHLVVKEAPRASGHHWYDGANMLVHDVIVPADEVERAGDERIDLSVTLSEVRRLPPFLSYQYVGATPAHMAVALAGGGPAWTEQEKANEPRGEIRIARGENVMFKHSGQVLGHVHALVYDDDELVAVVVRPHGLLSHDVLLQRRFLDRSDDDALFAHITEDDLKHLAPAEGT